RANVTASGGFCGMWNVAGFPAITIPFGLDPITKTPTGVQVAAPIGSDALLLSIAKAFENWQPWQAVPAGWA
ncbi:MAG TPA: amidase, partial [Actinomycetes bacterium]|nr:amidase [Actinomycetes bacterium]